MKIIKQGIAKSEKVLPSLFGQCNRCDCVVQVEFEEVSGSVHRRWVKCPTENCYESIYVKFAKIEDYQTN